MYTPNIWRREARNSEIRKTLTFSMEMLNLQSTVHCR